MADWQTAEQLPSLVKGGSLSLIQMIKASFDFARQWGVNVPYTEALPEPMGPIPGDGLTVNLVTATLSMGGAERHTVELALGLDALGYDVAVEVGDLWEPHQPLLAKLNAAGIKAGIRGSRPGAQVTIWWGTAMQNKQPAGSIYVAHSSSKLVQRAVEQSREVIDRIVGVSRSATAAASQAAPGVKASTIWNGVASPDLPLKERKGPGYQVGYLGRYDTEKGVALAIAALVHTPEDVRLRCYGRGPHKGSLATAADDHGVGDRVDLCGTCPDFQAVADEFDCLIVPDLVQGFPMTVAEALLNETPVVAVELGDLQHVLAGGRGIAVEPSPRALAQGIAEARRMPTPDSDWAEEHLTAEAMAASYSNVIHEVLS